MTHEKHIIRAMAAMGSGATPEQAAEALMKSHVYPETAYLAVMAATILLKDKLPAGVQGLTAQEKHNESARRIVRRYRTSSRSCRNA